MSIWNVAKQYVLSDAVFFCFENWYNCMMCMYINLHLNFWASAIDLKKTVMKIFQFWYAAYKTTARNYWISSRNPFCEIVKTDWVWAKNPCKILAFTILHICMTVYSSVADPAPDPVFFVTRIWIRIRENTGSGSESFIHKKTPVIQIFSSNKIV